MNKPKPIEINVLLTVQETQSVNINMLVLNPSITYCFTVHLTLDSNLAKGVKDNHTEGNTIYHLIEMEILNMQDRHNVGLV